METINLKEEADKIMKAEGQALGIAVRSGLEYTLFRKGKEGVRALEKKMAEIGYPVKHQEIKPMDFYPIGLEAVIFLAAKQLFNFKDEDFVELGEREAKMPMIVRLFMRYFGSLAMLSSEGPKMWKKYYTVGSLEVADFDEKKNYAVVRIKGINLHPVHCQNLKGYLIGIVKMVGKRNVACEEVKCLYRGDEYHEFLLKW